MSGVPGQVWSEVVSMVRVDCDTSVFGGVFDDEFSAASSSFEGSVPSRSAAAMATRAPPPPPVAPDMIDPKSTA